MSAATFYNFDRTKAAALVKALFDEGLTALPIAHQLGLPTTTVRRWIRDLKQGEAPKTDSDRFNARQGGASVVAVMAKPAVVAVTKLIKAPKPLTKRELAKAARARVGPPADFPRADIYPTPPRNVFDMPWPHYWQAMHGHAMTWSDVRDRRQKKLVVVSAQMSTPVHAPFFQALHAYCYARCAALIVIPLR